MNGFIFKKKVIFISLILLNPFFIVFHSSATKTVNDSSDYYNNTGIKYFKSGDYDLAESYLIKSLQLIQKNKKNNYWEVGTAYINVAAILSANWKFKDALSCLNEAEKIFLNQGDSFKTELGITCTNKGILLLKTGDFSKALSVIETGINYFNQSDSKNNDQWLINAYNALSIALKKTKKYNESLEFYNKALLLARKNKWNFLPSIYNNMAMLYEEINDFKNAELFYIKAINEYEKIRNTYFLSDTYLSAANFFLSIGHDEKALNYNEKAFRIARGNYGEKNPVISGTYKFYGDYYRKKNRPDSALRFYQRSICALFDGYNDLSIYSNPPDLETSSGILLLKILKDKASSLQEYFYQTKNIRNMEASLKTYDLAIQLIEKMRLSYQDMDSKLYLSENESQTYKDAVSAAYMLWQVTKDPVYKHEAFKYAGKNKSAVLLSAIRNNQAKGFGGIPDSLLQKEKELTRDIAFYKEKIYEEKKLIRPDSSKLNLWEEKVFLLNSAWENLVAFFEENYSKYYSLKYKQNVITIPEIQKRLEKDEALIEYSLDRNELYTFVVTRESFDLMQTPVDSIFFSSVDRMRKSVSYLDLLGYSEKDHENLVSSSSYLYNRIFKHIKLKAKCKRITIVPDDVLSLIPFEALITGEDETMKSNYNHLHFLVRDFAISYSFSSTMLFENSESQHGRNRHSVLAFAPRYEGKDTLNFRGNSRNGYRKNLSAIPGAKEEVRNILQLLRGEVFEDDMATERNFKLNAEKFAIIHLAMHGILDNENPMYSKLVFTAVNDSTEDGLLNTHEVFNLNLNAHLTVLSSCNSGEGTLQKGEGVMSLARGFSYAGCPSLIMTLWEIEDKSSATLMVDFYRFLKKGYPIDVALQKAKLRYIDQNAGLFAHPFFWSSFQCIGDHSSLFVPRTMLILAVSVPSGILIFILYLIRIRKKRFRL